MLPTLAIIGRPNVGKSTLFNRIVGYRKALTFDEPGVTRDRNFALTEWDGREFLCVDTGGFPLDEATYDSKVSAQIDLAIAEADVILCVFDGKVGLLPEEANIVTRLRKINKPIFFAVNKIDVSGHESRLHDFFCLGVDPLYPVSGEHGYKLDELMTAVLQSFPAELVEATTDHATIKVAIVGRPNVGKSSLTNALLGQERVVVDATPGTTRDSIDTLFHYDDQNFMLIDTAGIRRRSQKGGFLEKLTIMQSTRAIERADVCLQLLSTEDGLLTQDAHIAGFIAEQAKGLILVWNKMDLLDHPTKGRQDLIEQVRRELPFLPQVPIHFISAQQKTGIQTLLPEAKAIHQLLGHQVKTSALNRVFGALVEHHPLPLYKGRDVKLYYATQVGTYPPTFAAFSNAPHGVPASYRRYLIHGIQKRLGLEQIPIKIRFRQK